MIKKLKDLFKQSSPITEDILKKLKEVRLSLEQVDIMHRGLLADRWEAEDIEDSQRVDEIDGSLVKLQVRRDSLAQRFEVLKTELREAIRRDRQAQIDKLSDDLAALESERDDMIKRAIDHMARGLFLINHLVEPERRPHIWSMFPQREFTKVAQSNLDSSDLVEMFAEASAEARKEFEPILSWRQRRGALGQLETMVWNPMILNQDIDAKFQRLMAEA